MVHSSINLNFLKISNGSLYNWASTATFPTVGPSKLSNLLNVVHNSRWICLNGDQNKKVLQIKVMKVHLLNITFNVLEHVICV